MNKLNLIIGATVGTTIGLALDIYPRCSFLKKESKRSSLRFTSLPYTWNFLKWGIIGLTAALAEQVKGQQFAAAFITGIGITSSLPKIIRIGIGSPIIDKIQLIVCGCLAFRLLRK